MGDRSDLAALLVAVDFSPCSLRALDYAARWKSTGCEITALHVVDTALAERVEHGGIAAYEEAVRKLRKRAEEEFQWLAQERPGLFQPLVEGIPFLEVVKVARDLDVDLIVLGRQGRGSALGELLFGSTAEKVMRGACCPVLCVP